MSDHHDDHSHVPSDIALRVKAIESLLVDKGLVDSATIDRFIESIQTDVGPRNGAAVVAKAWTDDAFKQRLLEDATAVIGEMGITGSKQAASSPSRTPPMSTTSSFVRCARAIPGHSSASPTLVQIARIPRTRRARAARRAGRIRCRPRPRCTGAGLGFDGRSSLSRHPTTSRGTADLDEAALAELVTRDSMIGAEVLG